MASAYLQSECLPCTLLGRHGGRACPAWRPFHAVPRLRSRAVAVVRASQLPSERSGPELLRESLRRCGPALAAAMLTASFLVTGAMARPEGVDKPELLPKGEFTPVIDVAGFLTEGEENRICAEVQNLEKDKGVKLRVLAQNYPETPGLAIKDYWGVDDNTVVFVADPSLSGNILNFNVGSNIDLLVPSNFWSRLAGKYGSKFYWQEKGEGAAIVNTVGAIDTCFREPPGKLQCSKIQGEFGTKNSSGGFGKFFFGS